MSNRRLEHIKALNLMDDWLDSIGGYWCRKYLDGETGICNSHCPFLNKDDGDCDFFRLTFLLEGITQELQTGEN